MESLPASYGLPSSAFTSETLSCPPTRVKSTKLKESPEWADNRIAKLLGVDGKTVRVARVMLEGRKEIAKLKKHIGTDGKEYPRELENKFKDMGLKPMAAKGLAQAATTRERIEGPLQWAGVEAVEERQDYAKRVAALKKASRDAEERYRQEQRQRHTQMFMEVDARVSKARRELKEAIDQGRDVQFSAEEVELLVRQGEAARDMASLFIGAVSGDSGTDWDAELYELEQRRQWGAEWEAQ